MELVLESMVAFFAAVGIASLVWMGTEIFFLRRREHLEQCVVLIPVTRDAPALERTVAALRWVTVGGKRFDKILIADCGLDGSARERAQTLMREHGGVTLCTMDEAEHQIRE